jgi:hypothetical protein
MLNKDAEFRLYCVIQDNVDNDVDLVFPKINSVAVYNLLKGKLEKEERSFYSLYMLGCRRNGLDPFIISEFFKTINKLILLYGFEVLCYPMKTINKVIRQNILIKI